MADSEDVPESCSLCEKEFNGDKVIGCEGKCAEWFHIECAGLTHKQYSVIMTCKTVKWFCERCFIDSEVKKARYIKTLTEEVRKLSIKFNKIDQESMPPVAENATFAETVRRRIDENTLIIQAKSGENDAKKIQQQIKESIKPETLRIGVTNVRAIRSGKVAIEGMSKSDAEKLRGEMELKLGGKYEIKQARMRKPQIKIVGFGEEFTQEDLKDIVLKQNDLGELDDDKLKVLNVYKNSYNKKSAIVETSPEVFNIVMKLEKLKVGWSRCQVYEHTSILRCYRCNNYNHIAKECTHEKTCGMCSSSNHETKDCGSGVKRCINCVKTNEALQLGLDVNHSVYDRSCRVYQRKIEMCQRRTEYQTADM